MYSMLKDSHAIAAKTSLEVMISLYKVFLIFVKNFYCFIEEKIPYY